MSPIERRRGQLMEAALTAPPATTLTVGHSRKSSVPQGNQVGPLVRIAPNLRTILATHVALKLMDRCCLRPSNHIECNRLMRVATKAPHFEIEVARVQRVTQCRRRLRRPARKPSMRFAAARTDGR